MNAVIPENFHSWFQQHINIITWVRAGCIHWRQTWQRQWQGNIAAHVVQLSESSEARDQERWISLRSQVSPIGKLHK